MTRSRVTISGLLAAVVVASLIVAGLARPAWGWANAAATATVLTLLASILAARMGRSRPFWAGFAVFGVAWFLLNLLPDARPGNPHPGRLLAEWAFPRLHPGVGESVNQGPTWGPSAPGGASYTFDDVTTAAGVSPPTLRNWQITPQYWAFEVVVRHVVTISAAIAGGMLAVRFDRRGRDRTFGAEPGASTA